MPWPGCSQSFTEHVAVDCFASRKEFAGDDESAFGNSIATLVQDAAIDLPGLSAAPEQMLRREEWPRERGTAIQRQRQNVVADSICASRVV